MARIAPSILSADFAALGDAVDQVAPQADLLHVDVMDGHFVPNLTIGPPVVASLRRHTRLFLDCHLMIDNPGELLADFAGGAPIAPAPLAASAGVDILVAGSAIFGAPDPVAAARALREAAWPTA